MIYANKKSIPKRLFGIRKFQQRYAYMEKCNKFGGLSFELNWSQLWKLKFMVLRENRWWIFINHELTQYWRMTFQLCTPALLVLSWKCKLPPHLSFMYTLLQRKRSNAIICGVDSQNWFRNLEFKYLWDIITSSIWFHRLSSSPSTTKWGIQLKLEIDQMEFLAEENDCGQTLLRLVSRGSAIIAELFRLSNNIPG